MDGYVSTEDASELLGVSAQRVRTLLRDGTLAGRRQGRGWLVDQRDLERYRRNREISGRRRSGRPSASVEAPSQLPGERVTSPAMSASQMAARIRELETSVTELTRRNEELEEQLRRVRLLAELLQTEAPAGASQV